jgi:hypothetical protein
MTCHSISGWQKRGLLRPDRIEDMLFDIISKNHNTTTFKIMVIITIILTITTLVPQISFSYG